MLDKLIINDELASVLARMEKNPHLKEGIEQLRAAKLDYTSKDYINFLGVAKDDSGKISYLNKAKLDKIKSDHSAFITAYGEDVLFSLDDIWYPKLRIMARPSKVIRQICPSLPESFLEKFSASFKIQPEITGDYSNCTNFSIVRGDEIRKLYYKGEYSEEYCLSSGNNSNLWESCMKDEECQTYFDVYTRNTKAVSMAILTDEDGLLSSRCILWHKNNDLTYYDRIYAVNNDINSKMQAILESKGFINISSKNIVKGDFEIKRSVDLEYGEDDIKEWPYMDTMCYIKGRTAYNYDLEGGITCQNTDGTCDKTSCCCEDCGHECSVVDMHSVVAGRHEGELICDNCAEWSDVHDGYICRDYSTNTTYDGWVINGDVITLWDGSTCYEGNATELYNGEYAHGDREKLCEDVNGEKFIQGDDNFIEHEGDYYYIESKEYDKIRTELEEV